LQGESRRFALQKEIRLSNTGWRGKVDADSGLFLAYPLLVFSTSVTFAYSLRLQPSAVKVMAGPAAGNSST
jgi:hypothetical protein